MTRVRTPPFSRPHGWYPSPRTAKRIAASKAAAMVRLAAYKRGKAAIARLRYKFRTAPLKHGFKTWKSKYDNYVFNRKIASAAGWKKRRGTHRR